MTEHLVWGRLLPNSCISAGSTVVMEPNTSCCVNRQVLVRRLVSPMWGDGWLLVKIVNPTSASLTLRKNAKTADVYPCISLEDFDQGIISQNVGKVNSSSSHSRLIAGSVPRSHKGKADCMLQSLGLGVVPIDDCQVSAYLKGKCVFPRITLTVVRCMSSATVSD